eukprot:756449-Hanusia_phi.AAC.2
MKSNNPAAPHPPHCAARSIISDPIAAPCAFTQAEEPKNGGPYYDTLPGPVTTRPRTAGHWHSGWHPPGRARAIERLPVSPPHSVAVGQSSEGSPITCFSSLFFSFLSPLPPSQLNKSIPMPLLSGREREKEERMNGEMKEERTNKGRKERGEGTKEGPA